MQQSPLGSRKLNSTPSKCTIRTRFQTGMTAVLRHTIANRHTAVN
ncbi:hypothetical protein [Wolbachia endosymbiont (group A) of Rhinocyllus conicus]|nr:hypothetical protein [Wolbachia endosymbiont (group A) of Rhinocyllus conicus]